MKKNLTFILVSLACLLVGYFIGQSQGQIKEQKIQQNKTATELYTELMEAEKRDTMRYFELAKNVDSLDYISEYPRNSIVYTSIHNSSKMLTGKDFVVTAHYLTKTEKELNQERFEFNEYLSPGDSLIIRFKLQLPGNTSRVVYKLDSLGIKEK